MALDMVLAAIICKAAACTEHLLMPQAKDGGSPSVPIHAWHPHKRHCKTLPHTPHALQRHRLHLASSKAAFLTLRHCRYIFFCPAELWSIYRIRASSNARETGQMSLHRCISLLLTFTLPFPFTNSAGREREQRFKGRQYRNIFNHLL